MIGILKYWIVLALGVMLSALILPGVVYADWQSLVLVVILLSLFNLVLKPLMILFTLPFVLLTLGLGIWVINAVLLYFVSKVVDGFQVESFWYALGGALIISLTNYVYSQLTRPRAARTVRVERDRVIDV